MRERERGEKIQIDCVRKIQRQIERNFKGEFVRERQREKEKKVHRDCVRDKQGDFVREIQKERKIQGDCVEREGKRYREIV